MNIGEMLSSIIAIIVFLVAGALFLLAHYSYAKRKGESVWVASTWDIKSYRGKARKYLVFSIVLFVLSAFIYMGGNPVQ